jgi:nucleotide-binding universal stress UspA family protein
MALPNSVPTLPAPSAPFRSIVVAHPLADGGDAALAVGAQLARISGAALHFVHATPCGLGLEHDDRSPATVRLRELARKAGGTAHLRAGDPAQVISALAVELRADLIVIASRRAGGIARSLLESVAIRTLHHAHCAVLVVPLGADAAQESMES